VAHSGIDRKSRPAYSGEHQLASDEGLREISRHTKDCRPDHATRSTAQLPFRWSSRRAHGARIDRAMEGITVESSTVREAFSARPDRPLRANRAMLSTVGPTGAAAILDPESGRFYSLNEGGARVWSLLSVGTTFGAILERLQSEYDVTAERLGTDVELLLRQFASAGLLVVDGEEHVDI
jgi:hypothetical protein